MKTIDCSPTTEVPLLEAQLAEAIL